jgi:hypothetical protein
MSNSDDPYKLFIAFGPYFGKSIKQIGDTELGLLYLDSIVDETKEPQKQVIKDYLKKNDARLDAAIANKKHFIKNKKEPDPLPRPWWEK